MIKCILQKNYIHFMILEDLKTCKNVICKSRKVSKYEKYAFLGHGCSCEVNELICG